LKCGGGKKYQQRMCVNPKNGGLPCKGESILVKECNTKPCPKPITKIRINPNGETEKFDEDGNSQVTLKPVIKILPFSYRPQKYIKCIIKESDAFLRINNIIKEKNCPDSIVNKIPVRIVMNNSTISAFRDDNYHNNLFTVNLQETNFVKDNKNICCFYLRWRKDEYKLCGFESDCGMIRIKQTRFVSDWYFNFRLFKEICSNKRQTTNANHKSLSDPTFDSQGNVVEGSFHLGQEQKEFEKTLSSVIGQTQNKLIHSKEKLLNKQINSFEQETLENKVHLTQSIALNAIKREVELEELVQREEKAKEEADTKLILEQIIKEKRKEVCLKKAMKAKERASMRSKEKAQAVSEIERIKKKKL